METLQQQHCTTPGEGLTALSTSEIPQRLAQVSQWSQGGDGQRIEREFRFKDFYQTIAFVNAVAWIANQQDHHPDLEVGYNRCLVRYTTHAVGGLSLNDFICAARIDALER
ncbi:MAG: 4a-hydroxytetrahydrobiopterin dehydratase [Pseudomonadota bacterium]